MRRVLACEYILSRRRRCRSILLSIRLKACSKYISNDHKRYKCIAAHLQ